MILFLLFGNVHCSSKGCNVCKYIANYIVFSTNVLLSKLQKIYDKVTFEVRRGAMDNVSESRVQIPVGFQSVNTLAW